MRYTAGARRDGDGGPEGRITGAPSRGPRGPRPMAGWARTGRQVTGRALARIMHEEPILGETQEPPCGTNVVFITF